MEGAESAWPGVDNHLQCVRAVSDSAGAAVYYCASATGRYRKIAGGQDGDDARGRENVW